MAFYFTLSCLRSCVLLGCNCMYVYLATNSTRLHNVVGILSLKNTLVDLHAKYLVYIYKRNF